MKSRNIIIILGTTFAVTMVASFIALIVFINSTITYSTQLENMYKRSFYELSTNINNVEIEMSKLVAVNDTESKREVLTNIYNTCNTANSNISYLPIKNHKIENVNQFINVVGGYSYSLLSKVNNNQEFSDYDYQIIEELHSRSLEVINEYNNYISTLKFDYKIIKEKDILLKGINKTLKRGETALILADELNLNNTALLEFDLISNEANYNIYASAFEKRELVCQPNQIFGIVNPFKSYKDIFCCYNMAVNRACVLSQYGSVTLVINLISAYYKAAETTIGNNVENDNKVTMMVKEDILKLLEKLKKHNVTVIIYDSLKVEPKISNYLTYELSKVVDNFLN